MKESKPSTKQEKGKNPLKRFILRLTARNHGKTKNARDFARNTAILNDTPKNHKPRKNKVVQK